MPLPTPEQLKRKVPSTPISPPPIRRPRQTATNTERQALRRWWGDDSYGKREHKDAILWFKEQYGRELKTSTVSDYLGPKYAYLDNATLSKFELASRRTRDPEYKELEDVLAEWQLRYDRHPDSGSTTGDLLRIKAIEFWEKLPVYAGRPVPKFSNGWLDKFKKRHGIKERGRHGEDASAQVDEESEKTSVVNSITPVNTAVSQHLNTTTVF
jgi:hypothetical protein